MEIFYSENFKKCLQENQYDKIYLIRGLNRSIHVLNEDQWAKAKKKIARMERPSRLTEDWSEYFSAKPEDLRGKEFRSIHIPKHLEEWSKISEDVVLIHWPKKRIEIWAKELFPAMIEFEGTAKQ